MKRKSLSASLGSWCVQLVYSPRRTSEAVRRAEMASWSGNWPLFLPAFAALALGTGSGCFALAHFITLGPLTGYLIASLLGAVLIAMGACCGSPRTRRICGFARWPLVLILLFLAASARINSILPSEAEGESNSVVAVLVGLVTILSVLLVGVRSGGRSVPISAPLVPCLSLFGLLCLISVDTIVQICFILFVAAALYLLSYDRFLSRYAPELATGLATGVSNRTGSSRFENPPPRECRLWALQSLLVCSVWFALFMSGGALFYTPVQAILPRLVSPQLNRMRSATQGLLRDYRGSSAVMELRGGNYALSDREIMRVTLSQGETSGLWRGRVYQSYSRSRWDQYPEEDKPPFLSPPYMFRPNRRHVWSPRYMRTSDVVKVPKISRELGRADEVLEFVEPIEIGPSLHYASGVIISSRDRPDDGEDADWNQSSSNFDSSHSRVPYLVRSYVIRPRLRALQVSPGFEKTSLAHSYELRSNLKLPDDIDTRRTLGAISQQISLGQRKKLTTPYEKVTAISDYLIQNCTYSLHSPTVPTTQDAVVFFLTNSREGACDMFASSMALLLRNMGVPARIATGYLQPELPIQTTTNGESSDPQRPTWLVRERDAHAWVEYFVPGLGWLSYDPTVGTRTNETLPGQIVQFLNLPTVNVPPSVMLLPVAGLVLLVVGASWPRLESSFKARKALDANAVARARVIGSYREAQKRLRHRVPLEKHLTPHEYEARISRSPLPIGVKQEFAALTHLYIAARYGETPSPTAAELDKCVARLRSALRGKK